MQTEATALAVQHQIHDGFHLGQRIAYGDRPSAAPQEANVIFRIANSDDFKKFNGQTPQRSLETCSLVDPRRQNHHGASVHAHFQVEIQLSDEPQHSFLVNAKRGDD